MFKLFVKDILEDISIVAGGILALIVTIAFLFPFTGGLLWYSVAKHYHQPWILWGYCIAYVAGAIIVYLFDKWEAAKKEKDFLEGRSRNTREI